MVVLKYTLPAVPAVRRLLVRVVPSQHALAAVGRLPLLQPHHLVPLARFASTGADVAAAVTAVDAQHEPQARNAASAASTIKPAHRAPTLSRAESATVVLALRRLTTHAAALRVANEQHCISEQLWAKVITRLKRSLMTKPLPVFGDDRAQLHAFVEACQAAVSDEQLDEEARAAHLDTLAAQLMPALLHTAETEFSPQLSVLRERRQGADLRQPHTWYPLARSMKRRIIFHAGPTNSGKTYNALQALKNAWSGVYCGPLRLLALEVFESMNQEGVYTSLLTGQERRELPFARHAACTVEMLDVETAVDVAVLDEIQMIGDDGRGASWTRAVLGVPAPEVHLCGDPAAEPVVRRLCEITGDELEVIHYKRLTAITVSKDSLAGDYGKVQEGDAVVAFSRKDIYAIRRLIERKTHHKCCVVYGSLPPETRSAQARLFNDPSSGYRVLVASDAIGMGLNLNIRRVLFHTMNKYNGQSVGPVIPAQVKQIAGRAGRRSSIYPEGFATTLHDTDLPYLHACMDAPTPPITAAGLFPNAEQLAAFAALLPRGTPLGNVISEFTNASQLDGPYFMCRSDDVASTAALLEGYRDSLSMEQRAALCLVPANLRNMDVRRYFGSYMDQYTSGGAVRLKLQLPLNDPSYLVHDLEALEVKASALDMYLWLAARLGKAGASFPDIEEAVNKRSAVSDMLETALAQLTEDTKESSWAARRKLRATAGAHLARVTQSKGRAPGPGGHSRPLPFLDTRPTHAATAIADSAAADEASSEEEEEDMLLPSYRPRRRHAASRDSSSGGNGSNAEGGGLSSARRLLLRHVTEAAHAGISERTAQRLSQEIKRDKKGLDAAFRRQAASRRGSVVSTAAAMAVPEDVAARPAGGGQQQQAVAP